MKGSGHKDAYVRFAALVAAIVRIVRKWDMERTKISSFFTRAQKKFETNKPACSDSIAGLVREC